MEVGDYYCPETMISTLGYGMGRSARIIKTVTIETVNPLKASAAVGAVWGSIAALINARKYRQGRITKQDAFLDTAGETVGIGFAAGLGLLASNAVRASVLVASTSSVIPFTLGVVITTSTKVIWYCSIKRHLKLKCKEKELQQKRKPAVSVQSSA